MSLAGFDDRCISAESRRRDGRCAAMSVSAEHLGDLKLLNTNESVGAVSWSEVLWSRFHFSMSNCARLYDTRLYTITSGQTDTLVHTRVRIASVFMYMTIRL